MQSVELTPRNVSYPKVSTMSADVLGAYQEGLNKHGEIARKTLDVFSNRNGVLAGSNCFAPIELRQHLPEKLRLATMADIGRATEINPQFLRGFYSDTGLVLRTAGDDYKPNDSLAKSLARQLTKRRMDLEEWIPKIIYFDALNLRRDGNSAYGLKFVLNEQAKEGVNIFDAPELMGDYNFNLFDERGVPIKEPTGVRTLYTRPNGLSRFCLDGGSIVDSRFGALANSNDYGRVASVSAEGTSEQS